MPSRIPALAATSLLLLLASSFAGSAEADSGFRDRHDDGADRVIARAARAMGGERALDRLESFTLSAEGTRWTLDEGPMPGEGATQPGPYGVEVAHDVDADRFRLDYELVSFGFVAREISEIVDDDTGYLDGQDGNFSPPVATAMLSDRLASTRLHQLLMNPQLLVKALLDGEFEVSAWGRRHRHGARRSVLVIERDEAPPLVLYLGRRGLPRAVATLESDPLRRDALLVVGYSDWRAVSGGLRLPMRVRIRYDGELVQDETRTAVALGVELDDDLFAPPGDASAVFDEALAVRGVLSHQHLQSFAALGFPRDGFQPEVTSDTLAPGVHLLAGGSHNSLLVEHGGNGLMLVDAPLDEVRARALLDHIEANFADRVLTHVVQSHHHADHSAGIRTVVAAGAIPVVHETAEAFFTAVFAARSRVVPDALSVDPTVPDIVTVPDGGTISVGDGDNALFLYSFEQSHSEDLILALAGGIAFIVDLYNPAPGVPAPAAAQAIRDLVEARGLSVDTIAGGHGRFVAYEEFLSLLP